MRMTSNRSPFDLGRYDGYESAPGLGFRDAGLSLLVFDRVRRQMPGESPSDMDYAKGYFDIRPDVYEGMRSIDCYLFRTYQNFMELFGLVTTDQKWNREENRMIMSIKPTPLFDRMIYRYDFGDNWQHDIELEEVTVPQEGREYRVCTEGARRCPPEDCGGVHGYQQMLQILNDPDDPEREEYLYWLGGTYDPDEWKSSLLNLSLHVSAD